MQRSTRLRTPDKYTRSVFSSTQMDNRTRTPKREGLSNDAYAQRFNYSIESKKKASIIQKISGLAPFLEKLINKSQVRSAQIVERLLELRNHLDDIFDQISTEFEAAQFQNDNLRKSLELIPKRPPTADLQRLQSVIQQLKGELRDARSKESAALQQINQLKNESREAYQVLEGVKREAERFKVANSELQNKLRDLANRPPEISPEEYRRLKDALQKQRHNSMGMQENARRKLNEYESRLGAQVGKFRDLEQIHAALQRKSDQNERDLRDLKNLLEQQGRKSLANEQNIRRKIRQMEESNNQLRRKIGNDQQELQQRLRRIQDLDAQNADRERKLGEFARKTDLNEKQMSALRQEMENDRRTSLANEQNLLRKLKAIQDEKRALMSKASQNEQKSKEYEDILEKLTQQIDKQRRESMANQRGAIEKIKLLERDKTEMARVVDAGKAKQAEDEKILRQLYESIKDKERQFNQYIQDLTKKSTLHEDQIRLLQNELEKERRKSLADEATIKRLERVIDDQTKNTKDQVAMLQAQIENERRKSMADEAAIRKMEQILNEKVYFLNETDKKHKLAEDEIKFLKDEIDKERRKSMADEAQIRKLEQILQEKERYLSDANRKSKQYDDDIRNIKQELDNERRKSMADQATIKRLQGELATKIKLANDHHNKYLELARRSEAGDEQIRFLKAEIEKERRKSTADEATIKRLEGFLNEKVRALEDQKKKQQANDDEIKFLKDEIEKERRKSMADETKIKKLQEMLREKIQIAQHNNSRYLQEVRKSQVNAKQLEFLKQQLDKERRKSMADEATIKNLERLIAEKIKFAEDNEGRYINQIKILRNQIEAERRKSMADETKIKKLEDMLKEKINIAEAQKNQILELARKTDLNENEIRMLQQEIDKERRKSMADVAMIKKLEGVIAEKTRALQERQNSFIKNNEEIQLLKNEIDKQRRKSMQDVAQIRKLEQMLQQKIDEATEQHRRAEELARKSNLNEEQIKYLKDMLEKDRRASQIDQGNFMKKVADLENTKSDLIKKLDEDKQRFIKTANYIKQLEEKNQNAERVIGDAKRYTDLKEEEINALKGEIDNERRKSIGLQQQFLPKIHLLVDENQNLVREVADLKGRLTQADRKIDELNNELSKARQAIQHLEGDLKDKIRTLDNVQREFQNENYRNQQKLSQSAEEKNRVIKALEQELNRAKQDRANIQQQLNGKAGELQNMREGISQLERVISDKQNALNSKSGEVQRLKEGISRLERVIADKQSAINGRSGEVQHLKDAILRLQRALADKDNALNGRSGQIQHLKEGISRLERAIADKQSALAQTQGSNQALARTLNDLKARERELIQRNNELSDLNSTNNVTYEQHLQGYLKGKQPMSEVRYGPNVSGVGVATSFVSTEGNRKEKQHVIKVLEHERNIYRLETSINRSAKRVNWPNNENVEPSEYQEFD